ncbi:hypothetical protein LUZ60_002606 [Juncus effusus]|nr:hypothetical protein LUZ60_002606 [Juncus effusus]
MDTNTKFSIFLILYSYLTIISVSGNNFSSEFEIAWGDTAHAKVASNGSLLLLTLDQTSGARVQTYNEFQYGRLDMQIKLVPGNSEGVVATFYLSSDGSNQDEIDMEFLGNYESKQYILHTNIWTQGTGAREQQFHLWFDPRIDFHNYSLLWNPQNIILYVDSTPIRVFKNYTSKGVKYLYQPMRTIMSIWNGEIWATDNGNTKIDWSQSPFTSYYANYVQNACIYSNSSSMDSSCTKSEWFNHTLNSDEQEKLTDVQNNYMIANYCTNQYLYPNGFPPECYLS